VISIDMFTYVGDALALHSLPPSLPPSPRLVRLLR